MRKEITKLSLKDFYIKPKSSVVVFLLLLLYKIFKIVDSINLKLEFASKEKIISTLLRLSNDNRYVLNKISSYTKAIDLSSSEKRDDLEIHSVINHEAVIYYAIMAKSLLYFSGIKLKFVVHEDGSLLKEDATFLREQIDNVVIINFKYSTNIMKSFLRPFPYLLQCRLKKMRDKINIMTTVDVPFFTKSKNVIYMDSDMLFFNKPKQLCNYFASYNKTVNKILYLKDHSNVFVLSERKCKEIFRVGYIDRFNMGILTYPKRMFDLKSINNFYSVLYDLDRENLITEDQTYYMIKFGNNKKLEILDEKKYLVYGRDSNNVIQLDKRKQDTILCHYTSSVRYSIYKEAIILLFKMNNLN